MSLSKRIFGLGAAGLGLVLFAALPSCKPAGKQEAKTVNTPARLGDIKARLAKFAPTELTYDAARLSAEDRQVLQKLVEAARPIDEIFWRQSYPEGLTLKADLERSTTPEDRDYLKFLMINFGPFDRQDGNRPFIGADAKPAGAGFYPRDLTRDEFEAFIKQHPESRESFESPTTVIRRENGGLKAVPYHIEYKAFLEPMAKVLREASAITTNPSLKTYLSRRADGLLSNDYFQSDCDWIDLKDNLPEIVIGPFEVYEDGLLGIKASYESFVYINDLEGMKKLQGYLQYLDEMQRSLPVDKKYKDAVVKGLESPLNVVDEVFTAGDTKAGIQTSAFVLPNDERVREKKGTKKVFLKNVMEAKFNKSLIPISQRVLAPEETKFVTFDAYFNEVILHEISHVFGVNYITLADGTKTTVNKALKDLNSAIEEGKADIVGLYNVRLLMDKGWIAKDRKREIYATYLAGLFRAMRFGVKEAHGRGTLVQFNFLKEKGAILFDQASATFRVEMSKFEDAVRDLAAQFLIVEGDGSYEKAAQFLDRYGILDAFTENALKKLADIPVDIAPVFPLKF
jgi:hypothetical protein